MGLVGWTAGWGGVVERGWLADDDNATRLPPLLKPPHPTPHSTLTTHPSLPYPWPPHPQPPTPQPPTPPPPIHAGTITFDEFQSIIYDGLLLDGTLADYEAAFQAVDDSGNGSIGESLPGISHLGWGWGWGVGLGVGRC